MENKKQKITYLNNVIKVISLFIILISVSFAWFIFTHDVGVGKIETTTNEVLTVVISDEAKNDWDSKLEINADVGKVPVTEFSGNGDKLYSPIIKKNQITSYYLTDGYDEYESEKDYIEIVSYIKTNGPIRLFLDPNSSVLPVNVNNKKDLIAGAVRVAILVESYNPFIWAPNTSYQYNSDGTMTTQGEAESSFSYVYSDTDDRYITPENIVQIENPEKLLHGVDQSKRFVWGDLSEIEEYFTSVSPIFATSKDLNQEIEVKMIIRVWIEGTDREAVKDLIGGKFKIDLKFIAKENK